MKSTITLTSKLTELDVISPLRRSMQRREHLVRSPRQLVRSKTLHTARVKQGLNHKLRHA